jgi:hypothetical protein
MTSQRQIRRATTATQQARTLAVGEFDFDLTLKRLYVHDAVKAGGIAHANYVDVQNSQFTYSLVTGTDTLTATLDITPTSYLTGQAFTIKIAATNTTGVTIDFNSLGAKTIKKKDKASGTLIALVAGDLIASGMYTIIYNGTDFILQSVDGGGLADVSQGDLNTSTGAVSAAQDTVELILPGGEYGFFPQFKTNNASADCIPIIMGNGSTTYRAAVKLSTVGTSTPPLYVRADSGGAKFVWGTIGDDNPSATGYAYQRYVTASPPFDMGDGDSHGFVFALINKNGDIQATYIADVPPWGYNGPTKITADKINIKTGAKLRKVKKPMTFEEILDGKASESVYQEITQEIKNRDMNLIPHPFGKIPKDCTVVMLDPMSEVLRTIMSEQNAGSDMDFSEMIYNKKIKIDNKKLKRKGPKGVTIASFKR